jgi:purine-binding chemotaxis protein CheW
MATTESTSTDTVVTDDTQVLEFRLGSETYCVDIEYVAEIVDKDDLTEVPNSPRHVEGVMDLRGRTTAIVDPKTLLNVSGDDDHQRIVVLDPDELDSGEATGLIVDEVFQVVRLSSGDLDDSPMDDQESINGILRRDDQFVIWLDPDTLVD